MYLANLLSSVDQSFFILPTIVVYVFVHRLKEFASTAVLCGDSYSANLPGLG